jgi:hypothetical protein
MLVVKPPDPESPPMQYPKRRQYKYRRKRRVKDEP